MLVLGAFFTVSGAGKVLDVPGFAAVLGGFGFGSGWANLLAIALPACEIVLGLALLTWHGGRAMGVLCLLLIAGFTAVFAYAYFFRGQTECGCFGSFESLRSRPLFSFGRNALLFVLACVLLARPVAIGPFSDVIQRVGKVLICVVGAAAFAVAGISSASGKLRLGADGELGRDVKDLPFGHLVSDAARPGPRLIIVFQTGCTQCWNAMENVRAFAREGVVESVEGIAGGDEKTLADFREKLRPDFPIRLLPETEVAALVGEIPSAYLIRDGKVERIFRRIVPSPFSYLQAVGQPVPSRPRAPRPATTTAVPRADGTRPEPAPNEPVR